MDLLVLGHVHVHTNTVDQVYVEATVAFPLIVAGTFAKPDS